MRQLNKPKNIYIGNLGFATKVNDLYELFGLKTTKYLRETCKIDLTVNEKTGKCKGFVFALVPEHSHKKILKLNGITLENRIIVIEDVTSAKKRDTQNLQKHLKCPHLVANKHPENQDVFNS